MRPWLRTAFALAAAFLAAAGLSSAQEPVPVSELAEWLPVTPMPQQTGLVALRPIRLRYVHPEPALFSRRHVDAPADGSIRAVYVNAWAFGTQKLWTLIRLADETEINAFVIDVKDDTGCLLYPSAVLVAVDIGANRCARARDLSARLDSLKAHDIYPIARIVVAKDPLLARGKPQWAVRHVSGGLWTDRLGFAWVDAYNDSVWAYAADLAREAIELGFREIQFDYVRFPDEPAAVLASARFTARRNGETKRAAVRRQLQLLADEVKPLGVPFTIDVFGLTTNAVVDIGVGQVWEDLVQVADVVLPMVYPSHYRRGAYNISHPNSEPYRTVRLAVRDGLTRNLEIPVAAEVRPYLQAFTLGRPRYTSHEIREQIRAVEDLGLKSWVLWNPRSVYQRGSLRPYPAVVRAVSSKPELVRPVIELNQP